MIDVYTWTTGNGRKIPIFLEEAGTPYRLHMVDIHSGEQFKPEFIKINPNSKIPAIIDQDGPGGKPLTLFESGAILIYLADKVGQFIPKDPAGRYHTIEWVMFQMANIGPLLGQAHHFRGKASHVEYGVKRYTDEATRLWKVTGQAARRSPPISLALTTTSPTWRPMSGCAIRRTRARTSTTIRTSSAGSRRSTPARPCNVRTRWWRMRRRNTRR